MNTTEKLNELFTKWENSIDSYKGIFVRDGIINEQEWNITTPKILFITKEANQYGKPAAGDFRDDWQNNISKYPFAYRIAEWSFGIINNFPQFDNISKVPLLYHSILQRIAFLNIKKSGGIGTSSGFEIGRHLDQNLPFLYEEIEIIKPNIIILCLSFNPYIHLRLFKGCVWKSSGYEINVGKWNNCQLVDFYHPSCRNAPSASYSLLQNVFNSQVFKSMSIYHD
jgi:hypothetical protein